MKPTDERSAAATTREDGSIGPWKGRLLKVIAAAQAKEIAALLDRLWSSGRFRVRRAPGTGLVMCTIRDPFDTPFHLGEVLVSEAEVECDGSAASGVIAGDAPEKALLLAAVEAAESGGRAPMIEGLDELIARLEVESAEEARRLSKLAASTVVKFSSMNKESVDFGSLGNEEIG